MKENLIQGIIGRVKNLGGLNYSEEKLLEMINEGIEKGKLQKPEANMIKSIFNFDDKIARDVMCQRKNILAIEKKTTLRDTVAFMLNENKSRFPVYEDNLDAISGILHLRDAMQAYVNPDLLAKPIGQITGMIRAAVFIPETKKIGELFQSMLREKLQMVIIVDEYGQTAGLIAMEDILEEIVGSILDEYDEEEEAYIVETPDRNQFIIRGATPLEELEERFGISFAEEEFDTLNGFLISRLDKIPVAGEEFDITVADYNFKIQTVENRMITSVLMTKIDSLPQNGEAAS